MLLAGQRSFFELTVLAHHQPESEQALIERNLLRTAIRYSWHEQQSGVSGTVLQVQEIELLISWLRQLYGTGQQQGRLNFQQPGLGFECISASHNEFLIQIKLTVDMAPEWYAESFLPFWLPVVISKKQLANATNQLVNQFNNFPLR